MRLHCSNFLALEPKIVEAHHREVLERALGLEGDVRHDLQCLLITERSTGMVVCACQCCVSLIAAGAEEQILRRQAFALIRAEASQMLGRSNAIEQSTLVRNPVEWEAIVGLELTLNLRWQ